MWIRTGTARAEIAVTPSPIAFTASSREQEERSIGVGSTRYEIDLRSCCDYCCLLFKESRGKVKGVVSYCCKLLVYALEFFVSSSSSTGPESIIIGAIREV